MSTERGFEIVQVQPGSPAALAGVAAGDRLLRLNGRPIKDIIEYRIQEADEESLLLLLSNGKLRRLRIRKNINTPLGLCFASPALAPVIRCRNRCLFCFVDQNPPGLRPGLYVKDDDYRLSFLYGNFITLNHLPPQDLQRIIRLRLSPLYVSIHSTNPALRSRLFGSKEAARGLHNLRRLLQSGIQVHGQIVLCPGLNDGEELWRTIRDLAGAAGMASLAVVPVGLTAFRPPGSTIRALQPAEAVRVVTQVEKLQQRYLRRRGTRFVFLADEIYALAGVPFPRQEEYEGFPQLENGVGMARLFLDELPAAAAALPGRLPRPLKVTLATGREAAGLVERLVEQLQRVRLLEPRLAVVDNVFFGAEVTVAGLLTGGDLENLSGRELGDVMIFPQNMLKDGQDIFLDGKTPEQVGKSLGVTLLPASGPLETARIINNIAAREPEEEKWRANFGG